MKRALLLVALAAWALVACGGSLPQPRFVEHGSDEAPQEVPTPPPPGKVEIVPKRPPELKHAVWIDGEWEWTGRRWVWKEHGWQEQPPGQAYAPPLTMRRPPPDGTLVHLPGIWKKDQPPRAVIRLELAGADTHVHASLCGHCPLGEAGCCATPPGVAWSDAGRIVARGGADFLLAELAAGHLRPSPRGLAIQRVDAPSGEGPKRCVYHGSQGCTISPDRRAATCNHYVCDDALAEAAPPPAQAEARRARAALESLVVLYARWDGELGRRVVARWPGGAPWDAPFLDWLGAEYTGLAKGTPPALGVSPLRRGQP